MRNWEGAGGEGEEWSRIVNWLEEMGNTQPNKGEASSFEGNTAKTA